MLSDKLTMVFEPCTANAPRSFDSILEVFFEGSRQFFFEVSLEREVTGFTKQKMHLVIRMLSPPSVLLSCDDLKTR